MDWAQALRRQRMYGFGDKPVVLENGPNNRLDELQAAILRTKLKYFDQDLQKRQSLVQRYLQQLDNRRFQLPFEPSGRTHSWHLFAIRSPYRQELKQFLADKNIMTGIHKLTHLARQGTRVIVPANIADFNSWMKFVDLNVGKDK